MGSFANWVHSPFRDFCGVVYNISMAINFLKPQLSSGKGDLSPTPLYCWANKHSFQKLPNKVCQQFIVSKQAVLNL